MLKQSQRDGSAALTFDGDWQMMQPIIFKLLHQGEVPREEWQDLFRLVNHACNTDNNGAFIIYDNLHDNVLEFIKQSQMKILAHEEDHQALLKAYTAEWRKFFKQCYYLPQPFSPVERQIKGMFVIPLRAKEDKNYESSIRQLMLDSWNQNVFSDVKNRLLNSAMKLIYAERNGEAFDPQLVIGVRESYVNLCSDSKDGLKSYKENFERAFIEGTGAFYKEKAPEYLEINGVQNYMCYAEQKLKEEEQRGHKYFESYPETIQALNECCVEYLVSVFKEVILAECPTMIKNNETKKLQLMFRLMDRVPDGITSILKDLEHHIIHATSADIIFSADAMTQDFEKYADLKIFEFFMKFKKLVKEAFHDDPRFLTSRDKAFKQVIDNTSVFCRELAAQQKGVRNEAQPKHRCPKFLANYCSKPLRKAPPCKELALDESEAKLKDAKELKDMLQKSNNSSKENLKPGKKWQMNDFCRAIDPKDDKYYEAQIISIYKSKCTVKFLGYEEKQKVHLLDLEPSCGKWMRKKQKKDAATLAQHLHAFSANSSHMQKSSSPPSAQDYSNVLKLPFPMSENSGMSFLARLPPPMPHYSTISQLPYVNALLVSWHMTGYYVGLHQAQKIHQCASPCRHGQSKLS